MPGLTITNATQAITNKRDGREFDEISDAVDEVNVQTLKLWDDESDFDAEKDKARFRQYDDACDRVKNFYKEQHDCCIQHPGSSQLQEPPPRPHGHLGAMEMLNTLVDESDPDTSLSQIEHLLQTAEAIRRDDKPEWMQVAGLVHDLGKLLFLFDSEGQWDVVGDTFVVGCGFSDKIIYPETFEANPDSHDSIYSTEGSPPTEEALAMIRYHSFYPWHREGAYAHLTNEKDKRALAAVRAFNPYDLYSKSDDSVDAEALRPYYERLIAKFFPPVLDW
ncbi:myo-inositol oxygenase [Lactarius quietus]|nr:myo-inositol oxygenase [Lactarius quietus]